MKAGSDLDTKIVGKRRRMSFKKKKTTTLRWLEAKVAALKAETETNPLRELPVEDLEEIRSQMGKIKEEHQLFFQRDALIRHVIDLVIDIPDTQHQAELKEEKQDLGGVTSEKNK